MALLLFPLILLFAGKLLVYVPKLCFSSKYSEQLRSPQKLKFSGTPLLPPSTYVLFGRFGGDGSGGFGGVSGLDAGGGGGDGSPSLAGRDTDGEGDQEERHDD